MIYNFNSINLDYFSVYVTVVLDRKEDFLKGRRPHNVRGVRPREEFFELLFVFNPERRPYQQADHLIRHMR